MYSQQMFNEYDQDTSTCIALLYAAQGYSDCRTSQQRTRSKKRITSDCFFLLSSSRYLWAPICSSVSDCLALKMSPSAGFCPCTARKPTFPDTVCPSLSLPRTVSRRTLTVVGGVSCLRGLSKFRSSKSNVAFSQSNLCAKRLARGSIRPAESLVTPAPPTPLHISRQTSWRHRLHLLLRKLPQDGMWFLVSLSLSCDAIDKKPSLLQRQCPREEDRRPPDPTQG